MRILNPVILYAHPKGMDIENKSVLLTSLERGAAAEEYNPANDCTCIAAALLQMSRLNNALRNSVGSSERPRQATPTFRRRLEELERDEAISKTFGML